MSLPGAAGLADLASQMYGNEQVFLGFKDPATAKNPKQAAKWAKKEQKYGAYPGLARRIGRGADYLLTGEGPDPTPGVDIIGDREEAYLAQPLKNQSIDARRAALANYSRYSSKYNLGPTANIAAASAIDEGDRVRQADALRQARLTRLTTNRTERKASLGLAEELYGRRQGQMAASGQAYVQNMAPYFQALDAEKMMREATSAQNSAAMWGSIASAGSGAIGGYAAGGPRGAVIGATGGF